jgi:hypothetical protein
MKGSTAAVLLRAMRARIETWGVVQVGSQEIMALECAFVLTGNKIIKVIQGKGSMGITLLMQPEIQALREGYKNLDSVPNKEFKFDKIAIGIKIDPLSPEEFAQAQQKEDPDGKTVTKMPNITDGSWAKALNLNEEEITGSIPKPNESDNKPDNKS